MDDLESRLSATVFAFRGYNVTNLGRTPELLQHSLFGPVLARHLDQAGQLCSDILHQPVDLVARVRSGLESTLDTFAEDIGLIMGVELAHLELLAEHFGVEYQGCRAAMGYSLGEVTALVAGGVFTLEQAMQPLVSLATECADLARDVTMGIVFSRGATLDLEAVQRLCLVVTSEGKGVVDISSYLGPNTILLLGQGLTIDRVIELMPEVLPANVHLRKNPDRWPPLHTSLLWQRSIPNRAALIMQRSTGGLMAPTVPIVSMVTGKLSYTSINARQLMDRWIDEPQRLWDAICYVLGDGVQVLIHVGPEPNLIPATCKRLSDNVSAQLRRLTWGLGFKAMSGVVRRSWLNKLLSNRVALLRAPFVHHVILEDWLLAQPLPTAVSRSVA